MKGLERKDQFHRDRYPFEIEQNLKFHGLFFKPVMGTVAVFDRRLKCYVFKKRKGMHKDKNASLIAYIPAKPEELSDAIVSRLVPDSATDAESARKRFLIERWGVKLLIPVYRKSPGHHIDIWIHDKEEDMFDELRSTPPPFNAEAILRSFIPTFGTPKKKKKKPRAQFEPLIGREIPWAPA